MPKPVRVDPEAEEEIGAGVAWYEERRAGLGREFFDEVRTAVRSLMRPGRNAGRRSASLRSWVFAGSCSSASRT
jgi:hypothetical protein